jgi:cation diffusion facilitator CzcD-associated flavoprotein CzcO
MLPVENEYFDVVIVGAGLSGIGAACRLQRESPNKSFVILEGRDAMGGTWDLFRYPGIRSDSDMHTLGYNFKPWRESKAIADGSSILNYIHETAADYDVGRHIRYRHRVIKADWSSDDIFWTLQIRQTDTNDSVYIRCNFVLMCSGYYRYDSGYTPEFEGRARFRGEIVHPQLWPEDLDYKGKQVLVIGSGATAVTLVPAMAKKAGHVTMLQRSPTYILSWPDEDIIANFLRKVLPEKVAYAITRWKNITMQQWTYRRTRTSPDKVKRQLLKWVRKELGEDYDVDTHFTPEYNPWDQRLCLVPNGDLFKAIREGAVSVVTDQIESFTESGVQLESGKELTADIIITATGLDLLVLGGVEFVVDGESVDFSQTYSYKGAMFSGVPNLVSTFGYINASWTLRADLTAEYFCRMVNHLEANGFQQCTPRLRPEDHAMEPRPWITAFTPGYIQRAIDLMPMQGDHEPWINPQNYRLDKKMFLDGDIDDGALAFK